MGLVAPRPPSLFTGSILSWIVPIRLLGCRFHLQTLSLQEKATPKSGMAETWTVTAPLPYIAYFPFTTSPYRRICVLMYAYIAVWSCCHIYVNTNIRLYVYTPICIYGLPCGQFFIGWPFICRPPKMGSLPPFLFLMAHVLSRWKRSLVAELSSWSLLLSLVPSCPHLTLLSLFVLFRQGYSWSSFFTQVSRLIVGSVIFNIPHTPHVLLMPEGGCLLCSGQHPFMYLPLQSSIAFITFHFY